MATLQISEVSSPSDLYAFISVPYRLYAGNPFWVPPLRHDVKKRLTRHPFLNHADVRYFVAWQGREPVGRIAAIWNENYNRFHQCRAGFFGYFEAKNDSAIARALLDRTLEALAEKGAEVVLGPASPSSNYEYGLLIEGFDRLPGLTMPYNPPYYRDFLKDFGFVKAKDLLAYDLNRESFNEKRLELFAKLVRRQNEFQVRAINLMDFHREVGRLRDVYNDAWEKNWGFVPMTDEEFYYEAQALRQIADPRLVLLVEKGDEAVAFSLAVPDFNLALRHARGRLFPFGLVKILYHARRIRRA